MVRAGKRLTVKSGDPCPRMPLGLEGRAGRLGGPRDMCWQLPRLAGGSLRFGSAGVQQRTRDAAGGRGETEAPHSLRE